MSRSRRRCRDLLGRQVRVKYPSQEPVLRGNPADAEPFICRNCGVPVAPGGAGSKHRNHCPSCLASVHLDDEPGDREAYCGGVMDAVAVWVRKGGEWAIIHRCRVCGRLSSNRVAADDNELLLLSVAVRPLSMPPFPLERLASTGAQPAEEPVG